MSTLPRPLRRPTRPTVCSALAALLAVAASAPALASERRFTHAYESLVLGPGQIELEQSTTFRGGRDGLFLGFDERVEAEIGLVPNLQMAWYVNICAATYAVGSAIKRDFEFDGVSNEWKWKLLDPVADPMGLALYGEWTAAPTEAELEAKVIVDKRFGDLIAALNVVGEVEWELEEADEVEAELGLEVDAGLAYLITPGLGLGLELVNQTGFGHEGLEHSVIFAGPTLSWATDRWWAAVSVQPQVVDLARLGTPGLQDVEDHERVSARVLLGIEL